MRDDIVANAFIPACNLKVKSVCVTIGKSARIERIHKPFDSCLHDMQGGCLQRFDETLRETNRQAILDPAATDLPDLHFEMTRGGVSVEHPHMRAQF